MMKGKHLIGAFIGICTAVATFLYWKKSKKQVTPDTDSEEENIAPEEETIESIFQKEWTTVFTEHAKTYNGLFGGLLRIHLGNAKKPEKILREWSQRTHYKFENQIVDTLCQENILPLIEEQNLEGIAKWGNLLLEAAAAAGITRETETTLTLTEDNVDAYVEWDGNDLYPEDEIEVITPAWYQNGKVLEQGQCRNVSMNNAEED